MLGLGEQQQEVHQVLKDLRSHGVSWLTLGQYLQPGPYHLPVTEYITPEAFAAYAELAKELGFEHVASGPMVRSSYHADKLAAGETIA